jgi:hypothetical protein
MNTKFLLSTILIAGVMQADAQHNRNTYAITGDGNNDFVWMNIRQVDLSTGQVTKTLFQRTDNTYRMTNLDLQNSTSPVAGTGLPADVFSSTEYPTGTFVAAAAFDRRTNKLFFAPMRVGDLRWMDLSSDAPQFYKMAIPGFKTVDPNDEASNITRMVIGADGNGYALSNDGNHFFTFTTGKKPVVRMLGNLIDDPANAGMSIHNKCSSWGGDMIADAFGKLYVISASHAIFKIDVTTRVATFMGHIEGLPAGYTTNAAVVNDNGEVVLASANTFQGYYVMNINDRKAVKMEGSDVRYNVSDFANANLLLQKEANELSNSKLPVLTQSSNAKVFPNPVSNGHFNVLLENMEQGRYTVVVADLAGRIVLTRSTRVIGDGAQTERISLSKNLTGGVYIVKVINENNVIVLNEKVVVQ